MKNHLGMKQNQKEKAQPIETAQKNVMPGQVELDEKWSMLGFSPKYFENEVTFIKETRYPVDSILGPYAFLELEKVIKKWSAVTFNHPLSAANVPIEQLLFFDIETTGLSSGAGHSIFLLGYSKIERDEVLVRQYLLSGPSSEAAFYYYFLNDIEAHHKLVTYNGKAFDWPQVKTRHTFVRDQVPNLPKIGHYDLLHAARRFWKDTLPSCRLSIVEKEILQIDRIEDTPGYLAPMLYFDYLNEQEPLYLEGIIKHHEMDVMSLIPLYIHISRMILTNENDEFTEKEKYEIARWFYYLKDDEEALLRFRALTTSNDTLIKHNSMLHLALIYKKKKQLDQAYELFQILALSGEHQIVSLEELAKLSERKKDYDIALLHCQNALKLIENNSYSIKGEKVKEELLKRQKRLFVKLDGK
ncbi:hypothetical protein BTS2_3556 [Bacillus sp. TS-2]|nr:hypothetical protein BTS2_3556 [Bacillus sp. TS-2]